MWRIKEKAEIEFLTYGIFQIGNFTCHCQAGYRGVRCQHLIDHCAAQPCSNNGGIFPIPFANLLLGNQLQSFNFNSTMRSFDWNVYNFQQPVQTSVHRIIAPVYSVNFIYFNFCLRNNSRIRRRPLRAQHRWMQTGQVQCTGNWGQIFFCKVISWCSSITIGFCVVRYDLSETYHDDWTFKTKQYLWSMSIIWLKHTRKVSSSEWIFRPAKTASTHLNASVSKAGLGKVVSTKLIRLL